VLHLVPRGLSIFYLLHSPKAESIPKSEKMARESFLTFPPGAVAEKPQRIPVLWNEPGAIILNKPPGLLAFEKSGHPDTFQSVLANINERAIPGSQFSRFNIERVAAVNWLAREASGILLFATSDQSKASLRNELGSRRFVFRYRFFSQGKPESAQLECRLPVARHRAEPRALISHRTGKKTETRFHRIQELGNLAIWESESSYDRFHQVRLHAAEVGIPILNDPLYGPPEEEVRIKRDPEPFLLHLASLSFPWINQTITVEAFPPREFERLIRRTTSRR